LHDDVMAVIEQATFDEWTAAMEKYGAIFG
jgi:hypothetical protein